MKCIVKLGRNYVFKKYPVLQNGFEYFHCPYQIVPQRSYRSLQPLATFPWQPWVFLSVLHFHLTTQSSCYWNHLEIQYSLTLQEQQFIIRLGCKINLLKIKFSKVSTKCKTILINVVSLKYFEI